MKSVKSFFLLSMALLAVSVSCGPVNPASPDTPDTPSKPDKKDVEVTGITLSATTLSLLINEEETLTADVQPADATDKTVTWSSDDEAVATVSNGKVKGLAEGSATITATAGSKTATCSVTVTRPEPGPVSTEKMVDLGLPSGVKWAGWNVGASKPEEFGDYFSWGETKPKDSYWQDNYKYGVINKYGTPDVIYKYNVNEEYGVVDGRTRLTSMDDAAYVNWGSEWRMPTDEEKTELLANTTHTEGTYNEVPGWIFTSKINNVSIFFPATGIMDQTRSYYTYEETIFWTATLRTNDPRMSHIACNWIEGSSLLHDGGFDMDPQAESYHLSTFRYYGLPVRAVSGGSIPEEAYALTTAEATDVTSTSARVVVTITPAAAATEFGLLYSDYAKAPLVSARVSKAAANENGVVVLNDLTPKSEYHACAYAIVDGIEYTGNEIYFTTPK